MTDESNRTEPRPFPRRATTAACAFIAFFGFVANAHADDSATDREMRRAFLRGWGDTKATGASLSFDAARNGRSICLTASDDTGAVAGSLSCYLCSSAEALSAARSLGAQVRSDTQKEAPATIHIESGVHDAVTIDDIPIAPPAGSHAIEPGDHSVMVVTNGVTQRATFFIAPGERIELRRVTRSSPDNKKILRTRFAIASSGIGLALAGLGAGLLVLKGQCVDMDFSCSDRYDERILKPAGIALLATGAVLQAVMVALLWPRKREAKP